MSSVKIQPKYGKNLIALLFLISLFFLAGFPSIEAREDEIITVKTLISQDGIHPGKQFQVNEINKKIFSKINFENETK